MRVPAGLILVPMLVAAGCAGDDGAAAPAATEPAPVATSAPAPSTVAATWPPAGEPPATEPTEPATTESPTTAEPTTTSCRSVLHIGDSTSAGLVSADVVSDPVARLDAQYRRVGVVDVQIDASPGRSIIETLPDQTSGLEVAEEARAGGYRGCWVVALGTNDAANVYSGSSVGMADRIDAVMAAADGDPVLWVNAISQRDEGEWSEPQMETWNRTLDAVADRYPTMAIYEWDDVAAFEPDWFDSDGIHYTSAGSVARAELIADALVDAFPG